MRHGGPLGPRRPTGFCTVTHDGHEISASRIVDHMSRHSSCSVNRLGKYVARFLLRVGGRLSLNGVILLNSVKDFHMAVIANGTDRATRGFGTTAYVGVSHIHFRPKDVLLSVYGTVGCARMGGNRKDRNSSIMMPSPSRSGKRAPSPDVWGGAVFVLREITNLVLTARGSALFLWSRFCFRLFGVGDRRGVDLRAGFAGLCRNDRFGRLYLKNGLLYDPCLGRQVE